MFLFKKTETMFLMIWKLFTKLNWLVNSCDVNMILSGH